MNRRELKDWIIEKQAEQFTLVQDEIESFMYYYKRDLKEYEKTKTFREFSNFCDTVRNSALCLAQVALMANERIEFFCDHLFEICKSEESQDA